jgi:hypothetical protein
MSNEIKNTKTKLDNLCSQKEHQELALMKLKCDIREQKNLLAKLIKQEEQYDRLDNQQQELQLEQIDELPKNIKIEKKKLRMKK